MPPESLHRVSLDKVAIDKISIEASSIGTMTDRELLERIVQVAGATRYLTAGLLALLGECDSRRLYLAEGCSSLFTYCTQVLRLSEHAAYHRIEAARAARRFPIILEMIAEGAVTLTTVAILRPHLTEGNHQQLLAAARHRSRREVEHQVACLAPQAEVATLVRRLPAQAPVEGALLVAATASPISALDSAGPLLHATTPHSEPLVEPRSHVAPLAADRYLLRVTLSAAAHARLRRAQALMGHRVADGDPAAIISEALSLLVGHLERTKFARLRQPRGESDGPPASASVDGSRRIPAAMRRHVWARDEGRCAFLGTHGRCTETRQLEFHHVVPFARGGPTTVGNLALRCRAHNVFESDQVFAPRVGRNSGRTTERDPLDDVPR